MKGCLWLLVILFVGFLLYQYYGGYMPPLKRVDAVAKQLVQSLQREMGAGKSGPSGRAVARGSWSVVGAPSVSAQMIDEVLVACHSPAQGEGQAVYDLGVQYGIDPVFAPAFFLHESSCGNAGAAISTKSVGNIICTPGYPSCSGRFRSYDSWDAGFEDWFRLIKNEYAAKGLTTIDDIIPVYAPSSDGNDEAAYIAAIKQSVSAWRSGHVLVSS
jgi:Mannosyl-glycoprotein endo-beta-N-acetylglucosaminidase